MGQKPDHASEGKQIDPLSSANTVLDRVGTQAASGSKPLSLSSLIESAAEDMRTHISRQPHVQRLFSFMPTLMTRVSPFHFQHRGMAKNWPLLRLDSGESSHWGRMVVVGELLVIFDETILLCLLALLSHYQSQVFATSQQELCNIANEKPSAAKFNAIWKSIQRLAGTRIDLALISGKGKQRKAVKHMTGNILSYADCDPEAGTVRVAINPYFLEMYGQSFVTNIDLRFRSTLKGDVSKAIYRFFQGQLDAQHTMPIERLAQAVNLDKTDADSQRVRAKVRQALKELATKGYLETFDLSRQGDVTITKSQQSLMSDAGLTLNSI
jgi:hypothetical protein